MDISPFYELKNRLYYTASAGCSAVNEDFRLKRAVENFKPLADANKAFGKLYMMCNKLFESDNTYMILADCIALADALAVAQGTFNVSAETFPYENNINIKPANIHYSEYKNWIKIISTPSMYVNFSNINVKEVRCFYDPRFFSLLMNKISTVNKSDYLDFFAKRFFRTLGKGIIPMLKSCLDLSDPKSNGNIVKYVSNIAHADENDWYLELALNEDYPQNIRINAIEALKYCPENTDTLMELYRTQKGKIKNAVLYSLAVISPPEADSIWEKMTKDSEKFKDSNMDYISLSGSKICSDFAKKYTDYLKEQIDSVPFAEAGKITFKLANSCSMLANKTDVEDCIIDIIGFEKTSKNFRHAYIYTNFPNIIINNITNHPDNPDFRKLAGNLYNRNKEVFLLSEFLIRLSENPDTAFEILTDINLEQRTRILSILRNIWYSDSEKKYYINWDTNYSVDKADSVPIFDSIPESMLEFITDKSAMEGKLVEKAFGKLLESVGAKTKTIQKEIMDLCEITSLLIYELLKFKGCLPDDAVRIKKYASGFVFDNAHKFPCTSFLQLISEFLRNESPEKYKDLVYDYIAYNSRDNSILHWSERYIEYLESFPMPDSDKLEELQKIYKIYEYRAKNSNYAKRELETIKNYIAKYKVKGNN